MSKTDIEARIATARSRLAANLGELQQRVTRAKELVSPRTYLQSPWLKVGLGIAVGLMVGRRRAPKRLTAGDAEAPRAGNGFVRSAIAATMSSLVGALIEQTIVHVTSSLRTDSSDSPVVK